jgi:hypothetical protein
MKRNEINFAPAVVILSGIVFGLVGDYSGASVQTLTDGFS